MSKKNSAFRPLHLWSSAAVCYAVHFNDSLHLCLYDCRRSFFDQNYVGKTAFAALNLVWPVLMAVSTIGFLIGTGGCALVSKTLGEGNRERANQYFSMLITVTFIGTVVLSAIGFLLTPQIVTLLGAKGSGDAGE